MALFERIRPLYDRVLVQRIEEEDTTPGGIIIPDTAQEKPMQGEIIAVSNPHEAHRIGSRLPLDGHFKAALKIYESQQYVVSPFESTPRQSRGEWCAWPCP